MEKYDHANRQAMSECMETVESNLFKPDGSLKSKKLTASKKAKMIEMKTV
jgi:hypothetical protein